MNPGDFVILSAWVVIVGASVTVVVCVWVSDCKEDILDEIRKSKEQKQGE